MNLVLLFRTWRAQFGKVVLIAAVSTAWGWLMPFFYSQFSGMLRELAKQNPLFGQLSNFGSGSILTLPGTITLGMQHPFAIALISVFGVGVAALAIPTNPAPHPAHHDLGRAAGAGCGGFGRAGGRHGHRRHHAGPAR